MTPSKPTAGAPKRYKGERAAPAPLRLAAVGMEAEFKLVVDGREARPERVFGSPRAFLAGPLMHRQGRSYAVPTGGAVYFDTGVIEVATPAVELERGCAARAGRNLWEAIGLVRDGLDRWERRTHRRARLVGFSAHYNVSFDVPAHEQAPGRTVEDLAWVLAHVLPGPVALVAANRQSTGVGVRPRGHRVEVTVDFTPSPSLMIAACTLIAGVTRAVMRWPEYTLEEAERRGLPLVEGFRPIPHTSRKGWLAHATAYEKSPFETSPGEAVWRVRGRAEPVSWRALAAETFAHFRPDVRRIADPFTFRMIRLLMVGHAPSLLDLDARPAAYEDVGRACKWDDLFPEGMLTRSRYERVLIRAISGRKLRLGRRLYTPVGLGGWSEVVFRRDDGEVHRLPVDDLVAHLERWERP